MTHWSNVRDKPGFLHRLMVEFAGDGRMSLEGDLSRCKFPDDVVFGREEVGVLKRKQSINYRSGEAGGCCGRAALP